MYTLHAHLSYVLTSYPLYNIVYIYSVHSSIATSVHTLCIYTNSIYTAYILYTCRCVSVHRQADPDLQLQGAPSAAEVGHHRERHGEDQVGKIYMRV